MVSVTEVDRDIVIQCDALQFEKPDQKAVTLQEEGHLLKFDSLSTTYELVPFEGGRQLSHGTTHGELTARQQKN